MVFLFKEVTGKKIDLLSKQNKQGITILELRRLGVSGQKLPNGATKTLRKMKKCGVVTVVNPNEMDMDMVCFCQC